MQIPYTLLYVYGFFGQTILLMILDLIVAKLSKENPHYPLAQAIRVIIAASLIWLIIAFVAQIYMGWISF